MKEAQTQEPFDFNRFEGLVTFRSRLILSDTKIGNFDKEKTCLYLLSKLSEEVGEVNAAYNKLLKGIHPSKELAKIAKAAESGERLTLSQVREQFDNKHRENLKEELADVLTTLLSLSRELGVDITEQAIRKFNARSNELGYTELTY